MSCIASYLIHQSLCFILIFSMNYKPLLNPCFVELWTVSLVYRPSRLITLLHEDWSNIMIINLDIKQKVSILISIITFLRVSI